MPAEPARQRHTPARGPRSRPHVFAATMAAAGWGVVPVAPAGEQLWAEVFHADELTDNRPEMALDVVREYIAGNYPALWRPSIHTTPPAAGWASRIVTTPTARPWPCSRSGCVRS